MFLALLPLTEIFGALAKLFKEISSSLWDSRVDDERELVSPDALKVSFFEPNLDHKLDFNFSGGTATGTVRLLTRGGGSREIVEVIGSILGWLSAREVIELGEKGGSPAEFEPLRLSTIL